MLNAAMHEEEYKGHTIKIGYDDDPMNPRDNDNLGKMVCFHKRYNLGDCHDLSSEDFGGWDDVKGYLVKKLNAKVILPLYLYDHSGLHLKVGSFQGLLPQGHAEFDSGQVGFIYVTAADIRENWMVKRISKRRIADAERLLNAEVAEYSAYLNGQVYYYNVVDEDDNIVDSAYGFLGDYTEVLAEARACVDALKEGERGK